MLSSLIYVSTRKSNCTDSEIQKILNSCVKNNKNLDITGVLLYSEYRFIQYLEGEYDEIFKLYDKIKEDNRHANVVLISAFSIQKRLFPSWQMGSKKVNEPQFKAGFNFETTLNKDEIQTFNNILSGHAVEDDKAVKLIQRFF